MSWGIQTNSESAQLFFKYASSKHQNVIFIFEHKNIGSLSILDVKICRKNGKVATGVTES